MQRNALIQDLTPAEGTQIAAQARMYRAHGTITLVQEERFELACDDGSHKHFVLAHDAALEADELARLEQEGAMVEVEYDDAPDLIMHTAHRLWRDSHGSRH